MKIVPLRLESFNQIFRSISQPRSNNFKTAIVLPPFSLRELSCYQVPAGARIAPRSCMRLFVRRRQPTFVYCYRPSLDRLLIAVHIIIPFIRLNIAVDKYLVSTFCANTPKTGKQHHQGQLDMCEICTGRRRTSAPSRRTGPLGRDFYYPDLPVI